MKGKIIIDFDQTNKSIELSSNPKVPKLEILNILVFSIGFITTDIINQINKLKGGKNDK